ncbi:MAG: carbohydrate porin [Alphaproteobacteria bacterium]|nr:carbohydrate porin [Alphaproteobacteria bacterium]MDB5741098.1 carbohydrate porin [Alphaproteobacteria bacterium]
MLAGAPAWGADEDWAIHGQGTVIEQYHPAFSSAYRGANSLDPVSSGRETVNFTAYAGARPWDGGEAWADLEMDQGFGLSNTLGVAAFTNGEGSKVGKAVPYLRLHRLFFRQTFDLGGESEDVAGSANQLAGSRTRDNVIVTLGKFSPTDVFDNNGLAHDPMHDFLNWAMIDAGPWDYAADAWGYSYGGAVEWNTGLWSFRGGVFNLSRLPNGTELTRGFGQYQLDGEVERRYSLLGQDGKIKLLAFASRGRLGDYNDAVALATATHQAADISLVRTASWKSGISLNVEQGLTEDLGLFGRATIDDPSKEGEEFTDMANSLSLGLSLKGTRWQRQDDTVGLAFETGGVGKSAQRFFALGGLGILIGDGRLDHYDREDVVEAYYAATLIKGVQATLDYQFIANPAYNADRGPVSVFGVRLHGEF